MPFFYLNGDITTLKVDAIANAANNSLLGGGGVDGCIHRAAGPGLLRECAALHGCATGDAKITGAYRLPCRHVIHTVGPVWYDGNQGEQDLLISCYQRTLQLAVDNNCHSLAFPLISAGVYGYPKDQALLIASSTIAEFLQEHDLDVLLIIFSPKDFWPEHTLLQQINGWLHNPTTRQYSNQTSNEADLATKLSNLLHEKELSEADCCHRANIGRDMFVRLLHGDSSRLTIEVVYALAFALELSWQETLDLLHLTGVDPKANKRQTLIVEYFLCHNNYDIYAANRILKHYELPQLGASINPISAYV